MRVAVRWGSNDLELEVPEGNLIPLHRSNPAPPVSDIPAAVQRALEEPIGFPPLRRALTPDDQIAIAVDESIPGLSRVLVPLLDHLAQAHIHPAAITLLCQPPSTGQPWLEDLPDDFQEVRVEIHDPSHRSHLAYLATTRKGRRIYLNRTAVDADQLVVISRVQFDSLLGISAGEGLIFPGLSDEGTRSDLSRHLSLEVPGDKPWPARHEAAEVAWLLGAPFLVQVVPGAGEEIAAIFGGPVESTHVSERAMIERWRVEVEQPADVVIATITGEKDSVTLLDLARAFQAAARIVRPGGRIALLTDAAPPLGPASALMRGEDDPGAALKKLHREKPADLEAGLLWTSAAQDARLYLLSGIAAEAVEEMFATPLESVSQAQRFVSAKASCVILPEAHRTLAVVRGESPG